MARAIAQFYACVAEMLDVGSRHGRNEADDLLRMAQHRRSMHALRRVAAKAAHEGLTTATVRPADPQIPDNVINLAEARARRLEMVTDGAPAS